MEHPLALGAGRAGRDDDRHGGRAHQREDLAPGQDAPDQSVVVIRVEAVSGGLGGVMAVVMVGLLGGCVEAHDGVRS